MLLSLEFSGGLETIVQGCVKFKEVDVDAGHGSQFTVRQLLPWVRDNLLEGKPELFMSGNTIRPGILVLINDCDWELSGLDDSPLTADDRVTFISTLHGG